MSKVGFQFKKSYGQNFLTDQNIVRKIVKSADILSDSLVIEVGPGAGALTRVLSANCKQVLAYEIDERLEDVLTVKLVNCKNVDVIFDDFLKRDLCEDLKNYSYQHLYMVSNLPYYITTPIITKLIESGVLVDTIVVMVQKEVGDRFSATPGTKDYGSLTVFLNYYFEVEKLFVVGRQLFVPRPNVDSIVVRFTRRTDLLDIRNLPFFFTLVRDSFRFKRKTLRNNLKQYDLEIIASVLARYHIDLTVRAEQLPLEIFVEMSNALSGE